jgi:hypothetical protein
MDNDINNIKKMYDNATYFDQYGGSVVLFVGITIVVLTLVSYFHTLINIQPIIDDWPNQRCSPAILPFAGLINRPDGVSASDYTSQNFTYCTQNILTSITGFAVQPLTTITNSLQAGANSMKNSIQSTRAMFDKVRTSAQSVSQEIMGRLMNIMMPLMQIIISFKDLIGKIQGTMTASLFTLLGGYYTLKALMGAIAQFIISILFALAVMISILWAIPITWGAAAANTAIFVSISIPLAIILVFMKDVLKVNTNFQMPKVKCFDKDTLITMNDGTTKKITLINVGDVLSNNNVVTAKMKVAKEGSIMYNLDNVIVSDTHIVKYEDRWIHVCWHPRANKVNVYNEDYLYCLNTTHKIIEINNNTFTDWDEVFGENIDKLLADKINPIPNIACIHECIDYGFNKSTKICLENGLNKDINEIKVNDTLYNGEKVYGIVEIDGSTLNEQFIYNLGENTFVEGYAPNLSFISKQNVHLNDKLYNLLTDKGTFKIQEICVPDYNVAIDRFLE